MLTGLVSPRRQKSWLAIVVVVGLGTTAYGQTERIWTDARGVQISAELDYVTGNHVVFNSNGRQICIPLSAMSEKDRKFIHRITRTGKTSGFAEAGRKG